MTPTPHQDTDQAGGEDLAALILRRISELDTTQKRVAEQAGIPYSTFNSWVKRRRGGGGRIDPDQLRALAKELKITAAEVFAAAGRRAPGPLDEEREAKLLRLYRNMPPEGQRALIQTAEAMSGSMRVS